MNQNITDKSAQDERINWYEENVNLDGNVIFKINNDKLIAIGNIIIPADCEGLNYKIDELYGNIITANTLTLNSMSGNLKSLKNFPEIVHGYVDISCNRHITSLEGCPRIIDGYFKCNNCKISSTQYISDEIGGELRIYNNPLIDIKRLTEIKIGGQVDVDFTKITFNDLNYKKLLVEHKILPVT